MLISYVYCINKYKKNTSDFKLLYLIII